MDTQNPTVLGFPPVLGPARISSRLKVSMKNSRAMEIMKTNSRSVSIKDLRVISATYF